MSPLWIRSILSLQLALVVAFSVVSIPTVAEIKRSCRTIYSQTSDKPWVPLLRRVEDLSQIPWNEISRPYTRPPEKNRGNINLKIMEGFIGDEKVFIKVSHARPEQIFADPYRLFLNEVAWTEHLSEIGLGPLFKGITLTPDGHLAIVTEFIEGTSSHIPAYLSLRFNFKLTPAVFDDLTRIKDWLLAERVDAFDLEVSITANRAYLIDPAYFKPATSETALAETIKEIDTFTQKLRKSR